MQKRGSSRRERPRQQKYARRITYSLPKWNDRSAQRSPPDPYRVPGRGANGESSN